MGTRKTKISRINYAIIETDESGNLVLFEIPHAALYYDMACVKLKDQDKVDDTMDELVEVHYAINEN